MLQFKLHIHIAATPIHTTINLLFYTFIAVILPGLCIQTPVAIYDPKGFRPAEACGISLCQGIYPDTGYTKYASVFVPCYHISNSKNMCVKIFF